MSCTSDNPLVREISESPHLENILALALSGQSVEAITSATMVSEHGTAHTPDVIRGFLEVVIPQHSVLVRENTLANPKDAGAAEVNETLESILVGNEPRDVMQSRHLEFIVRLALLGLPAVKIAELHAVKYSETYSQWEIQTFLDSHFARRGTIGGTHYEALVAGEPTKTPIDVLDSLTKVQSYRLKDALMKEAMGDPEAVNVSREEIHTLLKITQLKIRAEVEGARFPGEITEEVKQVFELNDKRIEPGTARRIMRMIEIVEYDTAHGKEEGLVINAEVVPAD